VAQCILSTGEMMTDDWQGETNDRGEKCVALPPGVAHELYASVTPFGTLQD
jgi:hypothetical protein